jgi:myo-inositol 2-dehydrogenase/D-chiro-inositol 1-dehydrogenase
MIRATDPPMSPMETWSASGMRFPVNFNQLLHVDDAYVREIGSFAAAVRNDTAPPLSAWDARQALAMALAAVESSQTGRPVELPNDARPEGV